MVSAQLVASSYFLVLKGCFVLFCSFFCILQGRYIIRHGWVAFLWSRNLFGVVIMDSELCNRGITTEQMDNHIRDETTVVVTSMLSFPGTGFVPLILRCFY